jgi:hypothetical protein
MAMKRENKERVLTLIREGNNYKKTKEILRNESGDVLSGSHFYRLKETVHPSQKMTDALEEGREKRVETEKKSKTEQRRVKWSTQKQKSADESKLAELINTGLYHGVFPFCKSQDLKLEDVKEINMGGAVVGSVLYFFPDINLDHPLIVLTTRGILFYIRFRSICNTIREKVDDIKLKIPTKNTGGLKEGWRGVT